MTSQLDQYNRWQRARKGEVHREVFERVRKLESEQSDMYDRFVRLESLYDPNGITAAQTNISAEMAGACENAVASNIDTITATVATTDVRTRILTDGASWSEQRRAKQLEYYVEGIAKLAERKPKCRSAFRGAGKKGTGLVKVYADAFDQPCAEHVIIDDIVIDPRHRSKPRELHQRHIVDRDELVSEFPDAEERINSAHGASGGGLWADYRPIGENEVVMLESWYLPYGTKGHEKYRAGRHTKTIDGHDLLDEPYHKPRFPFARQPWTERDDQWHGIGGAERAAGSQRALNRRNLHIEIGNDRNAFPTVWVRQADAGVAVKTRSALGAVSVYKSDIPKTEFTPAVSPETYRSRQELKESINNEFGNSSLATHGMTPAGLETGAAVREYRGFATQRFADQEDGFERLCLDVDWLLLDVCKDLAAKGMAPVISKTTRWGTKKITWAKVDMRELKVQMSASSTLPRTAAGRSQMALEWAQAGVISMDVFRRLTDHPDLEKEWSLFASAIEALEEQFEAIADGEVVTPEPFDNLKLAKYRGQQTYLLWRSYGAPEEVLEGMRQYVVQAIYLDKLKAGAANANAAPGMPGGMPGEMPMDPTMATPDLQSGAPADPSMAALSPQAMQLRAV